MLDIGQVLFWHSYEPRRGESRSIKTREKRTKLKSSHLDRTSLANHRQGLVHLERRLRKPAVNQPTRKPLRFLCVLTVFCHVLRLCFQQCPKITISVDLFKVLFCAGLKRAILSGHDHEGPSFPVRTQDSL